jgi:PAT family beta-lactamase induction signal transducer AmpG
MASAGVDLGTLGLLSLVALPYSCKVAWAPLVDRYRLPRLPRRRGWIAVSQLALAAGLALLGAAQPTRAPVAAALALAVALASATQDVAADAYSADVLRPDERAAGTAVYVLGYRVAMVLAGAGALVLADHASFRTVYLVAAALAVACVGATVWAPEPAAAPPPASLEEAVLAPFRAFFARRGAWIALAFLTLYRLGDLVLQAILAPFLLALGFSRSDVGMAGQGVGLCATIVGALGGGWLVARAGLARCLLVFGLLQAITNTGYCALALVGPSHALLYGAVAVDNLCSGLAIAAQVAFLMSLCDRRYSATQFALLTGASSVAGRLVGGGAGYLAAAVGWPLFFVATTVIAAPALALVSPLRRRGLLT